jgi:hypothetical protein
MYDDDTAIELPRDIIQEFAWPHASELDAALNSFLIFPPLSRFDERSETYDLPQMLQEKIKAVQHHRMEKQQS